MKNIAKSDLVWMCIFFALGIFVIISSNTIRIMVVLEGDRMVNSRFVPRLVGALMCAISAIWFIKDFIFGKAENDDTSPKPSGSLYPFLGVIAAGFLYIFILQPVGFIITSWAFLTVLCIILKIPSKKAILLMPILTSIGTFFLFRALGIILPGGILRFLW